jgi:transcription antitermination factor NusG
MLTKKGIQAWVPLQKLLRRYTRSTRWVEKPLINGYVFVRIIQPQYVPVLETENVAGFVRFSRNLIAIPDAEIDILRKITLESDLEVDVIEGNLSEGDPVEIRAGSLAGLKGRVLESAGKRKLLVELEHLGYSLLITIDVAFLEKTSPFN